jgi:hypothetical protein
MKGFRSGEPYWERGLSAADIVNHEIDELGNEIKLHISMEELARIPSRDVAWVCKTRKDAERYCIGDKIQRWDYKRILAEDMLEDVKGYLVELE